MTVNVTKPQINVREKLSELDKPSGIAGEAILRSETPQEVFNYIGAGRRNLIINGDMQVAQRGTSGSVSNSSNTYLLDRFFSRIQGSAGSATVSQDSDSPNGFDKSLKFTVGTADTSLGSGHYQRVHQSIEGFNILPLAWGTSDAKPATLSFWVKGSIAGIYSVGVYNGGANRSFVSEYQINQSNTWEYKIINIPPTTSGTWEIDNTAELQLSFSLGSDSLYSTSSLDIWQNAFKFSSDNTINLMATSGATWQVTGVQLEVGKVATPSEHRSYGEELALCQRYCQMFNASEWDDPYRRFATALLNTTVNYNAILHLVKPMRANPTLATNGTFNLWNGSFLGSVSAPTIQSADNKVICIGGGTGTGTQGGIYHLLADNNNTTYMLFDAEL